MQKKAPVHVGTTASSAKQCSKKDKVRDYLLFLIESLSARSPPGIPGFIGLIGFLGTTIGSIGRMPPVVPLPAPFMEASTFFTLQSAAAFSTLIFTFSIFSPCGCWVRFIGHLPPCPRFGAWRQIHRISRTGYARGYRLPAKRRIRFPSYRKTCNRIRGRNTGA